METLLSSPIDEAQVKANRDSLIEAIEGFRACEVKVHEAELAYAPKAQAKGKLLPRERLGLLLDRGTPFLELMSLAGHRMHDDKDGTGAGGGLIAGIGQVEGRCCLIVVNNYSVKGGTISPAGLDKTLRLQEIALTQRLPIVSLSESGGANLKYATDVFIPGATTFANQARLSAQGIPQVTVVHGNATAGGAYQPGLSDYVVLIKEQSKLFLAGPPLLKAATGEVATDEALGGANLHAELAGTGEYLVESDREGILKTRQIVATLPAKWCLPEADSFDLPKHDIANILSVIPASPKQPYQVQSVLEYLADASEALAFKPDYDAQTYCGHIRIEGHLCGVIGNNGPITAKGAQKAAQFIYLCEQSQTPLLFLHNTTGFMVGTESESSGIIKHGSKLIQAVTNAQVPKISLVIGGSFGAGNYAMCGRGIGPDFIFAWPNARTAVMGGEQAGKVLRIVTEAKAQRTGQPVDEKTLDALEQGTARQLDAGSTALYGTARLWDDGLIDPRDSRRVIGLCLAICQARTAKSSTPTAFGVPRF